MALVDLGDWINQFSDANSSWYIKRLAANDTLASGAHQAGPYFPKKVIFELFPSLHNSSHPNPDVFFPLKIDSHDDSSRDIRAVWYNNKYFDGTGNRDETRLTNFGGKSSALLNENSTGAIALFCFQRQSGEDARSCHVWVCRETAEEEFVENKFTTIDPGQPIFINNDSTKIGFSQNETPGGCHLSAEEIPPKWLTTFPTGREIIEKSVSLRPYTGIKADERLLKRRACEYQVFLSIEEARELPVIQAGFDSVDTFVARAQSVLQRRKSRSGNSLELHARQIMIEEGLVEGTKFEHNVQSESGRRPDFLFPSKACYDNMAFPKNRLRMLGAKTTCKDRWRQIINEAKRIETKHLLTLQEGVSESQFKEMSDSKVKLVVPRGLIDKYPKSIRPKLQTLGDFIAEVRGL